MTPLPCLCANLRRAARAVTQLYDEAFRSLAITAVQFTLLQALDLHPRARQGWLADLLAADSTTLTRNLGRMKSHGWIESQPGADRRERLWSLTSAGRRLLAEARPLWEETQQRLSGQLPPEIWAEAASLLGRIVAATRKG